MWQTLTIIAVFILGFQAYLAYENQNGIEEIIKDRRGVERKVAGLDRLIADEKQDFATAEKAKDEAIAENKKRSEQRDELLSKLSGLRSDVDSKRQEKESKTSELAEIEEKTKGLPDTEELQIKLSNYDKQINGLNSEISDFEAQLANFNKQNNDADAVLKRYEQIEADQRARVSAKNLSASIAQAYQNFGFVILNAGFTRGVVPDSTLEVVRDGEVVAKLEVTTVEASKSAADIVGESLGEGIVLRPGDRVRSVRPVIPDPLPASSASPEVAEPAPSSGADDASDEDADEFDFDNL